MGTPGSWKAAAGNYRFSLNVPGRRSLARAAAPSACRELSAAPSAGLEAPGLALLRQRLRGGTSDRRLCQEPRRPRRPARVSCGCGGGACLSCRQSLDARLLARDSQALQLKRSCLWFSGCVSGTRLSLKPLIYHQENNQICPWGPHRPPPPALSRSFPSPPLCWPPAPPAFPYPAYSFHRIIIIHFFLSSSPTSPSRGPAIHPSSSFHRSPRPLFPPFI